ncbi:hypothetical protein IQ265_10495 [Nodosilinea sp. LEGE 06152]|uniref:hypothetical protein n=1 Tax=Nodosilinea sp. LEGE 06152 TaxID=2777966 RepID=UPI001881ABE1|nr:hypothetical protein [Nodosilinea sp. LEGE 06152]MBE9157248.1 hypothetical protein [Nodosilinea sp. LEGE 06152]
MTAIDSATLPTPDLLEVVASGARLEGKQVTAALLKVERQTKQQRQQLSSEALLGTWRLRFTAPKKPAYRAGQPTGSGFYVPGLAIATIGFSRGDGDGLAIQNQLQVGPIRLRFTGPAKFLPKKNLLAFDFVRLQVLVGGLSLIDLPLRSKAAKTGDFADTSVAKLPFFAFFAAQKGYVAARGRSGGLALWVKQP